MRSPFIMLLLAALSNNTFAVPTLSHDTYTHTLFSRSLESSPYPSKSPHMTLEAIQYKRRDLDVARESSSTHALSARSFVRNYLLPPKDYDHKFTGTYYEVKARKKAEAKKNREKEKAEDIELYEEFITRASSDLKITNRDELKKEIPYRLFRVLPFPTDRVKSGSIFNYGPGVKQIRQKLQNKGHADAWDAKEYDKWWPNKEN